VWAGKDAIVAESLQRQQRRPATSPMKPVTPLQHERETRSWGNWPAALGQAQPPPVPPVMPWS
jgi:hypothetical protein